MECLPNRLTPLYSEIHYEEENYLKVRTAVFKYITPSIVKFGTSVRLVREYVSIMMMKMMKFIPPGGAKPKGH